MLNREQATKKLLAGIAELLERQYDRAFINEFLDDLNYPEFETKTTVRDWQHYVPAETIEFWHFLEEIARISMWMMAFRQIPEEDE